MPAPFSISKSIRVGEDFTALAAGDYDLTAQAGRPERCVRRILVLVAATFSVMSNSAGVNGAAVGTAVPAGTMIDADISAISFTGGPVQVFW